MSSMALESFAWFIIRRGGGRTKPAHFRADRAWLKPAPGNGRASARLPHREDPVPARLFGGVEGLVGGAQ